MSKVRDAFLNAKPGAEIITVRLGGKDVKVEMREKTVHQQMELVEKATKTDGDVDSEILNIEAIIATTFDPDTGEPVFEAADRDAIRQMPARPFFDLLNAANKAAGITDEDEVVADLDEPPASETSTG